MSDPDTNEVTENAGTTTTQYRWKYLSTVTSLFVVIAYTALVIGGAFGYMTAPVDGGTWATFSLAFLAVLAYTVGVDTLKAAREARK